MFGKADPYAKLRIGTQEFSSKPNPGGGKNPVWNEEFTFDISNEKEMEVEVLDKVILLNILLLGCIWGLNILCFDCVGDSGNR